MRIAGDNALPAEVDIAVYVVDIESEAEGIRASFGDHVAHARRDRAPNFVAHRGVQAAQDIPVTVAYVAEESDAGFEQGRNGTGPQRDRRRTFGGATA